MHLPPRQRRSWLQWLLVALFLTPALSALVHVVRAAASGNIVEAHGGTILVKSQVGLGTTVRVAVPAAPQHSETTSAPPRNSDVPV